MADTLTADNKTQNMADNNEDQVDYMLDNPASDIVLICKDDVRLYFSKWPLTRSCIVLKKAITSKNDNEIKLLDYNSAVVKNVLKWIDGCKKIPKTCEMIRLMYEFAHQYEFKELEDKMEEFAIVNPTIPIIKSLKQRNSKIYIQTIQQFIVNNKHAKTDNKEQSIDFDILNDIMVEQYKNKDKVKDALDKTIQLAKSAKIKDMELTIKNMVTQLEAVRDSIK